MHPAPEVLRMLTPVGAGLCGCLPSALLFAPAFAETAPTIEPSSLPRIGSVDARFQSYNIEMVEFTGGGFWEPHPSAAGRPPPATPPTRRGPPPRHGPDVYQYHPAL